MFSFHMVLGLQFLWRNLKLLGILIPWKVIWPISLKQRIHSNWVGRSLFNSSIKMTWIHLHARNTYIYIACIFLHDQWYMALLKIGLEEFSFNLVCRKFLFFSYIVHVKKWQKFLIKWVAEKFFQSSI